MTSNEFIEYQERLFEQCKTLRAEGQREYAHDENDAFANFRRSGEELFIGTKKALMVLLRKHYDGIVAHVNGHESQREEVTGRIKDAINYLTLLGGIIQDETTMNQNISIGGTYYHGKGNKAS